MAETIDFVFRDFNTPGLPGSGEYEPEKPRIRRLLRQIQGGSGQSVTAPTLAALEAITPPNENYMGIVLDDPDAENNGYYYRQANAWVFGRGFPDTFARVELSGSGTAQTGAVATGVTPSTIEVFFAFVGVDNTGPLTLSIAGEPPREVVNLAGNPLAAGEWTGAVMFALDGSQYRMLLDAGSAASAAQSASEAADSAAEASASADSAAASAAAAGAASGRLEIGAFDELATKFVYSAPGPGQQQVASGDVITWREMGFAWKVVASGATDANLDYTGSGGVKLYALPLGGVIYPEMVGAVRDGVSGSAALLQLANDIAQATGSRLESAGSDGAYYLDQDVTITVETDIRCPINVSADGAPRILYIGPSTLYDALDFSDLGNLVTFSNKITGLPPEAAGRYLEILSDEHLTERITGGDPFYEKLTAVYVIDDQGTIVPSLDMTFNSGYNVDVRLMHKETRLRVRLHSLHCVDETGDLRAAVQVDRDNVDVEIEFTSNGAQWRNSMSIRGNGCRLASPTVDDSAYPGSGYGINIGLTCNTLIENMRGGINRHAISGRHGSLVTIINSEMYSLDTHWGNDFRIIDCSLGRVDFSGKDLTIRGGTFSPETYAVYLRADVMYAIGKLDISDVTLDRSAVGLFTSVSTIATPGIFTSPRRMFHHINIRNIKVRANSGSFALIWDPYTGASAGEVEMLPPRSISISDIDAQFAPGFFAYYGSAVVWPNSLGYTPVVSIKDVRTTGRQELIRMQNPNNVDAGVIFKVEDCGEVYLWMSPGIIERLDVVRCDTQIRSHGTSPARGPIFIHGGYLSAVPESEPSNPLTAFNVVMLSTTNSQYNIAARRGCLSAPGVPLAQSTDYINPSYYANT